jgi:hypothetical protein
MQQQTPDGHGASRDRGLPASTTPATTDAAAGVLSDWQQATGHLLRPERRELFLARAAVGELAAIPAAVRQDAAHRLWSAGAQLLLDEWLQECRPPVGADPATTSPPARRMLPAADEIEAARSPAGGWSRDQLAAWGVSWPPPKGWKAELLRQQEDQQP